MLLEHERSYGLGMGALVTVCSLGMDALVTICSWNTNGVMVWAWMLWSPYALGTRTETWLGHGCLGHPMLLEHEEMHGFGMDALVIVCSWSSGTREESWFGHGCFGCRVFLEHDRSYVLGMDALVMVRMTSWVEHSPNLKVHKPSICSLASKMAAWNTPQMTSKPSNPLNTSTHTGCLSTCFLLKNGKSQAFQASAPLNPQLSIFQSVPVES